MLVSGYYLCFQLTLPTFPVVVKIGHAHSGMGKVRPGPLCSGVEATMGAFAGAWLWTVLLPQLQMNSFRGEDYMYGPSETMSVTQIGLL